MMDEIKVKNLILTPCSNAMGMWDLEEKFDGENKKESWSKSYYGMTLERAIELMVQKLSFDESRDLREFICKYKELKEELIEQVKKLKNYGI